jgi:glycosyltransferase involved in cell wall biosynthesis
MEVLFLDNETNWRGGQEQIFTLIRGLYQEGLGVALAAPSGAPLSRRVRALGVTHFPLRWRGEINLLKARSLIQILRRRHWDVIHFNTPRGIATAAFLSRRVGIPVRVLSRRVNFPLRGPVSRWKYLYSADRILTVSSGITETLIQSGIPASRVEVVYEGVDVREVENAAPARLYPPSEPVIGCVAYLSEEKGHATLLDALALLLGQRPAARLVLVGDGPLRIQLERQARALGISERVRFLGFQEHTSHFLRGFDIFVLPSLSEGLSSGILAAMAASLPVVASDIGGIPELVQHRVTGLLVPPRNPEPLAEALTELIDSADLRHRYGQAGRSRVMKHFTLEQKVKRTLAIYEELLNPRRHAE